MAMSIGVSMSTSICSTRMIGIEKGVLESCKTLRHVKQVHAQILRSKVDHSNSLLLELLLCCCTLPSSSSSSPSALHYALSLFTQIPNPHTRFSNQLFRRFSRGPTPEGTLLLYRLVRRNGTLLDRFSFPPLLKAVSKLSALNLGLEVHGLVSKLYEEMKISGMELDSIILCTVLSACGHARNLSYGKAIHEFIKDNGFRVDSHLQTALVNIIGIHAWLPSGGYHSSRHHQLQNGTVA
ncbi:Pentatricopeptide repeat-containing protein [Vigna angularis]|uniref:Pentatricopeptide repeat-containing protein n=1 Tax=Phaseolus angularis TaxID=3914 RepID=A0A8T0JIR2_PHAAN|nr:Pentatricopeptide repeat-containing protein [Vigna angularis]